MHKYPLHKRYSYYVLMFNVGIFCGESIKTRVHKYPSSLSCVHTHTRIIKFVAVLMTLQDDSVRLNHTKVAFCLTSLVHNMQASSRIFFLSTMNIKWYAIVLIAAVHTEFASLSSTPEKSVWVAYYNNKQSDNFYNFDCELLPAAIFMFACF